MEKKINLEEIANSSGVYRSLMDEQQKHTTLSLMLEFGKQLLELAAENAKVEEFYRGESYRIDDRFYDNDDSYVVANKQSILNTIKQVE